MLVCGNILRICDARHGVSLKHTHRHTHTHTHTNTHKSHPSIHTHIRTNTHMYTITHTYIHRTKTGILASGGREGWWAAIGSRACSAGSSHWANTPNTSADHTRHRSVRPLAEACINYKMCCNTLHARLASRTKTPTTHATQVAVTDYLTQCHTIPSATIFITQECSRYQT